MIRAVVIAVTLVIAAPVLAKEPVGCDKFKWPLDHERALLASPAQQPSGADLPQPLGAAVTVALQPLADAKLPTPPSRAPKAPDSYAGYIKAAAPPKAGAYRVTLSAAAWIDVIQNGQTLKSTAFSGATGCAGIRKSVKFDLTAAPFTIELSGTTDHAISFVVTPD